MPKGQLPFLWVYNMLCSPVPRPSFDGLIRSTDLEGQISCMWLHDDRRDTLCMLRFLFVRIHLQVLPKAGKGKVLDGTTSKLPTCSRLHNSNPCNRYEALRWAQQRDACCRPLAACSFSMPLTVTAVPPRKISFRLLRSCKASAPASLTCLHLLRSRYASKGMPANALTAASLMLPQPRRFNLHAS